jgi:hypothetical protein
MVALGALALLAAVVLIAGAARTVEAEKLLLTYPNSRTLLRATAGPGLSDGKLVGTSIKLPPASKAGKILYTATTPDGLAFTAGVNFDPPPGTAAMGHSFLTVTDTNGANPKVIKTFELASLRTGILKGCPLAAQGDITAEKIGVSHHVFVTLTCLAKCNGRPDRSYVLKYSYSSASQNLAGPSTVIKYQVSSQGCAASEAAKQKLVQKLKCFGTTDAAPGVLYAVIGSAAGTAAPALFKLDSGKVNPTGVAARVPFYRNGGQCSTAEIRSPATFFAQCQSGEKNVVAYVSNGAGAKALGGKSTLLSSARYGPMAIGTSSSVLYSLKVTKSGTYVAAHAKSGATASPFTSAFRVPAGATDLDAF